MSKPKIYVSLADCHYPKVHKPTLNAVLEFLDEVKVDGLIFQGDQLDMQNISHHTKGKPGLRSESGYLKDIQGFNKEVLKPIEQRLKKGVEKYWIIGNHEDWEQDLVDEHPEFKGLIDHVANLELKERGYEIIPLGHSIKLGKLNIVHGEILSGVGNQGGAYPAKKAVELYAGNVLAAHSHAPQMFVKISPVEHTHKWAGWINGILGATNPQYLRNRPTAWQTGFSIIEVREDGNFNLYLVIVNNGVFSYGGKTYGG
jgi:hypothetical protein